MTRYLIIEPDHNYYLLEKPDLKKLESQGFKIFRIMDDNRIEQFLVNSWGEIQCFEFLEDYNGH